MELDVGETSLAFDQRPVWDSRIVFGGIAASIIGSALFVVSAGFFFYTTLVEAQDLRSTFLSMLQQMAETFQMPELSGIQLSPYFAQSFAIFTGAIWSWPWAEIAIAGLVVAILNFTLSRHPAFASQLSSRRRLGIYGGVALASGSIAGGIVIFIGSFALAFAYDMSAVVGASASPIENAITNLFTALTFTIPFSLGVLIGLGSMLVSVFSGGRRRVETGIPSKGGLWEVPSTGSQSREIFEMGKTRVGACPHCGTQNLPSDATFCPHCGRDLPRRR
jgi:hypothetical protein